MKSKPRTMMMDGDVNAYDEDSNVNDIREGFQVINAGMLSLEYKPEVRFTKNSVSFNAACVRKMWKYHSESDEEHIGQCQYVEMLLNPTKRMIVVRPCSPDHPNAIRWATEDGKGQSIDASTFCKRLFTLMDWDESYRYRVQGDVLSHNGEMILRFDLSNFICVATQRKEEENGAEPESKEDE